LASKTVYPLEEVQPDTDYALVVPGSYLQAFGATPLVNTIRFTQTKPYRFVVSGRTRTPHQCFW